MIYLLVFLSCIVVVDAPVDRTKFLQTQLDRGIGRTVTLSAGIFHVSTLKVPPKTKLVIGKNTVIKALPIRETTNQSMALINLSSNSTLEGGGTLNGNRKNRLHGAVVKVRDASNVLVNKVRIVEAAEQGIQIEACRGITIRNTYIRGCGNSKRQHQGINIVIASNIVVDKCYVEDAEHGIQWWGDDVNGYCENLVVKNNTVRKVQGGGIWGNKGKSVSVIGNSVRTCGDVGIDFENTFNSRAVNNTVENCKNYGLAVFFGSEDIMFANNKVIQGPKYGHGVGFIGKGTSRRIAIVGGSVFAQGISSCGFLTVGTNVVEKATISKVRITTTGVPIRIVENNNFKITNCPLITGKHRWGISLEGSSNSLVENNTIVYNGVDNSALGSGGGIFLFFRSEQYPSQENVIRSNRITGYKTGINDDCWGNVNSNNRIEKNAVANIYHKGARSAWGGKAVQNFTINKTPTPILSAN